MKVSIIAYSEIFFLIMEYSFHDDMHANKKNPMESLNIDHKTILKMSFSPQFIVCWQHNRISKYIRICVKCFLQ